MRIAKNNEDDGSASEAGGPGQAGASSQPRDKLPTVFEGNISRREKSVLDDEAAVLSREKLIIAREGTANVRERVSDQREDRPVQGGHSP